jgi:hypothetical protein
MKQPKVLVACPTYAGKNYCIDEWMKTVKRFKYFNYDILMVDNTNDNGKNAKWIMDTYGINVIYHYNQKVKGTKWLMAECNEVIRKYFLDNDYDYLFSLEADVMPRDETIIQKFINFDCDIVTGMYDIGDPGYSFPLIQKRVVYKDENGDVQETIRQLSWQEIYPFLDGTLKNVFAAGIGCALIKKKVLEKVKFRISDINPYVHADSIFYMDTHNEGFRTFMDTSMYCWHMRDDKAIGIRHGIREEEFKKGEDKNE